MSVQYRETNKETTIPEGGMRNCTINPNQFMVPEYGSTSAARSQGGLHCQTIGTSQPLHDTPKACNCYAQGYPTCTED